MAKGERKYSAGISCLYFIIFAVLIPAVIPCAATGQTLVGSISFEGNSVFSDNNLKSAMLLKPDKQFTEEQLNSDLKSIRERYRENGYLLAKISGVSKKYTSDSSYVDLKISITEGKQALIGELNFKGNRTFTTKEIEKIFETKTGSVLDNNTLSNDIKSLLDAYEKKGSLFTKATIDEISLYNDTNPKIRVGITIKEESKIKISNIRIKGNEDTREKVILREIRLNDDKTITRDMMHDIKYRLEKLNIFSSVEEPKIYTLQNKNESGLLITVKEGNTNTFDGILGYVPPANENEKGYFTGLVNLSFRNLFGTARRLDARWQQETKSTQELELKYSEPYFFGLPLNISGGFLQRIQDTSYTHRKFDFKSDILITNRFTLGFSAGVDRVIPPDSAVTYYVADSRTLYAGTEIKYDSRDNVYIPESGILYHVNYTYGDKKIYSSTLTSEPSFSLQRYSMDIDFYSSFFRRQSLLIRFFVGQVTSDKLEDADFYKVGGINNVRGYREEQFRASKFTYGTVELRYAFSRKSFGDVFFDPGYYYRPADFINNIPKQEGFIFGYGLGIRLETAIGLIGVSYAMGKGDGILDGKIHFGLVNEF
ncbi:MAG: BamA/TamA family outer membrane protein [Bacteroidetes bacterium]|nr:BamA/TamA family outer membrane protein [Bacteroidota bacterium]